MFQNTKKALRTLMNFSMGHFRCCFVRACYFCFRRARGTALIPRLWIAVWHLLLSSAKSCPYFKSALVRPVDSWDSLTITILFCLTCWSEIAYMTHTALNSLSTLDSIFQLHTTNSVTPMLELSNQMDMIRRHVVYPHINIFIIFHLFRLFYFLLTVKGRQSYMCGKWAKIGKKRWLAIWI